MDVFEALYTTRAMRRVKEDPVPDNIIKSMIDSAIRAPSGSNRQNWKFLVVTDKNIREKLSNIYRETWDYYINSFLRTHAPYNQALLLQHKTRRTKERGTTCHEARRQVTQFVTLNTTFMHFCSSVDQQ